MRVSLAAQVRQYLVDNPGWHFASDVCDALDATSTRARQNVAATLGTQMRLGTVDRKGAPGSYRFAANARTAAVVGHPKRLSWQTPVEQAFEEEAVAPPATAAEFITAVRVRSAAICGQAHPLPKIDATVTPEGQSIMSTTTNGANSDQVEELLGMGRVTRVTGHSKTWIYDRVNDGSFPAPIKVGRRTLWVMSEVQRWVRSRIEEGRGEPV